ncbi:MAG TPA: helix-turn-helix transcriptional regulator [Allosphingosinicella sp.]|jgi:transcriptional regulator with XRE-family HTH domain
MTVSKYTALPSTIGTDLLGLRTAASITQGQLAQKAGMDQSRISRMEKGDALPSAGDVERLLGALGELGSDGAAHYAHFLGGEWHHIDRPDFSNPQISALELADETLGKLDAFLQEEERPWPLRRQLERQQTAILQSAAYLHGTSHQIAFIGEVGVGKSTAISFLYSLLEPASPDGRRMERVVLETGGGHTTLCEVNIRRGPACGILVQPQSDPEMRALVGDFCASTWLRRPGAEADQGEKVGVSEEVQRALRNMSGLTVKRERGPDGKNVYRDQAIELAQLCLSEEEFRARVLDRMQLETRTRRELWVDESGSKGAMQQLRATFRDVNNGRLGDVPMPGSIDIMLPGFGGELPGLTVSVVDTKGMDEVTVRPDLDARLKDNRTHVVLCSTFNQAPSTSTQLLLEHLRNAHGLRVDAGKVSVLALPRPGEALGVKDDAGLPAQDDEDGYNLKRDQIIRQLCAGDSSMSGVPVFFFNAHDDDPAGTVREVYDQVAVLRQSYQERLLGECAAVEEILRKHQEHAFTAAVQEVATQLGNFLAAHRQPGARVRQAYQELIETLRSTRYASTVWAMTRRNGEYYNFSTTHQIGAGGAKDAMLRSRDWFSKLQAVLDTQKQDAALQPAEQTIKQIEASTPGWRRAFVEAVRTAAAEIYREELEKDENLWRECYTQWGRGPGFRDRVVAQLRTWFERRTDLNDKLEQQVASAWEYHVLSQLERLTDENASSPDTLRGADNVVPFRRAVASA